MRRQTTALKEKLGARSSFWWVELAADQSALYRERQAENTVEPAKSNEMRKQLQRKLCRIGDLVGLL